MPLVLHTPIRVATFIATIVIGTALVIVATFFLTGSWAVGATAGAIAGVLSATTYPVLLRKVSAGK